LYTLTFTEPDGGKPQSHPIADGELLIGRDATCDVVLRSKDVSRRHARFFVKGGELLVEDLGSHNGVWVRGARIEKPAPVEPGAAVEIGDVKVSVKAATEAVGAGAALKAVNSDKQIKLPAKATVGRGADCDVVLDDDSVSRIDPRTRKVVATIKVGNRAAGIAVGEGAVWVTVQANEKAGLP